MNWTFFGMALGVAALAGVGLRKAKRSITLIASCIAFLAVALLAAAKLQDFAGKQDIAAFHEIDAAYVRFNNLIAREKFAEALELIEPSYRKLLESDPEFMAAFKLGFGRLGQPESALYPSRRIHLNNGSAVLEIRNIDEIGFTYEVEFVRVSDKWLIGKNLQVVTGG